MQKRSLLVIAAVALALVVVRLLTAARGGDRGLPDGRAAATSSPARTAAAAPATGPDGSGSGSGSVAAEASPRPGRAPATTVRLAPDDRRRLGEPAARSR